MTKKPTTQEVVEATTVQAPQEVRPASPKQEPTGLASNVTAQDLRLPRIALLQALSPQLNENDALKAGMLFNTLTQEALPAPVEFTPVFVFKNVIKYRPREEGGGIIYKTTQFTEDVIKDCQWESTTKPVATEFINAVALIKGEDIPVIISFSKTSLKSGQDLLTFVQLSGQAWKYSYFLESQKVIKNNNTFYVLRVKRGKPSDADTIVEAASLYNSVKGMSIDTDFEDDSKEHSTSTQTAEPTEF